ncbi:hypothetical protein ACJMK2_040895 [Sinanodonta woodiana]|uniref:PLAT domain-containing protein n=1 Tax=Sinanodonta woodiana TaxID=1069815 RepID=A0ABD3W5M7_SINWO
MFRLFTRQNEGDTLFQTLLVEDAMSITNSNFDHAKRTKMVVHGFRSSGLESWMMRMKNELLKAGDFNVILIDWANGANVSYNQATVNTRVVGAVIAKLITVLKEQAGANPEDFHIIGHSLGAHISGYAGERLPNLGRITGLDPAALNFENKNKMVRLDPTDAIFVDVIHTDGRSILLLGLGMFEAVGHADYYPNGGLVQPGCMTLNIFGNNPVCRHLRAYEYFIESINSECPFQGYRCKSYKDFKQGLCLPCSDEKCGYMGFHADKAKPHTEETKVTYFLDTGGSKPFCRYHYQITVSLANVADSRTENGKLLVNLMGSNGNLGDTSVTSGDIDIEPGKTYVYIVTSPHDLGILNTVTVSWLRSKKETPSNIYIEELEIVNGVSSEM